MKYLLVTCTLIWFYPVIPAKGIYIPTIAESTDRQHE